MPKVVVSFADSLSVPPKYALVAAKHRGKWVFVRHRERDTFEMPGGHIEPGESAEQAARRELREESGAAQFEIWRVGGNCVDRGGEKSYGVLFYAEIESFNEMPEDFEMAERVFLDEPPAEDSLTYPDIIPAMIARAQEWRMNQP